MKQETKERLHKIELLSAIGIALVLIGVLSLNYISLPSGKPTLTGVTGFVPADVISQPLNIDVTRSQEYSLSTSDSFTLTSLRLSGSVEGSGIAQIFLIDGEKKYLIYNNIKEKEVNKNLVTGQAIDINPDAYVATPSAKLQDNQETVFGSFYEECGETCFIKLPFSQNKIYRIAFYVDENTAMKISELTYTTG